MDCVTKVVLYAGCDERIVRNRVQLLAAAGYLVHTINSPDVIDCMFNGDFDLVLLCNSIPNAERSRLARIIRNYCPSTPVLVIADFEMQEFAFGTRTVNCDSEQVIRAVRETLGSADKPIQAA
ncbi:MAG TPA: hypothetical protein VFA71_01050 [Terriglobales bacterium]|nr:hypothetical protein [Terriglobales bacterium]